MTHRKLNWSITLGIIFGVTIGVVVSKTMDRWPAPVMADGSVTQGKKVANDQAEIFRLAAKTIAPAVVNITTVQRGKFQEGGGLAFDESGFPFFVPPKMKDGFQARGVGSGFIFDAKNGYIMTNNHVVAAGNAWIVRLWNKRELEARLVGADPQTDVAVLKVDSPEPLTASAFGDSNQLEVGDWVLAVGNPFGFFEQTVTAGIISAKGRHLGLGTYEDYLQTDAAINQGNSGGPLVNLNGEVVGMNTAIFSHTGGYQGIGFSIPINQARKIALKLIERGSVTRGWLGIEVKELNSDEAKQLNLASGTGVSVEGVYLRGPAHKAQLMPGDILLKFDGKDIRNASDVRDLVAGMDPGSSIKIQIARKGEPMTLNITLGTQPKDWGLNRTQNQ